MLKRDISALPYLYRAILCHLRRFPSVRNAVQEAILEGVANGIVQPVFLFAQISNQFNDLGMGVVQFWAELDELVHAEHPVIELEGGRLPDYSGNLDSDFLRYVRIRPTSLGCELLQGRADCVHVNGIKRWLGGYQAHGKGPVWRWNGSVEQLMYL
ncbi:hypothetical protein [Paenibacillus naphthalenovorans]|uniref:hypothetical protein n=1 Tax=Paenibacillus naphthalenovorans TaxID=162209 RepID=UPI000B269C17|nr:hypothetical protein [Paenibacillus naphthalenovorans]